jgi:hypothetical protein
VLLSCSSYLCCCAGAEPERTTAVGVRGASERAAMKYVLVTGGVVSGLGKGVTASSIGVVLKACGLRVTTIKIGTHSFPLPAHFSALPEPGARSRPERSLLFCRFGCAASAACGGQKEAAFFFRTPRSCLGNRRPLVSNALAWLLLLRGRRNENARMFAEHFVLTDNNREFELGVALFLVPSISSPQALNFDR